MKDSLVNIDTAKLAQEKGFKFDEKCWDDYEDMVMYSGYYVFGYHYKRLEYTSIPLMYAENHANSVQYTKHIDQPSHSLLKKWLREVHGIYVNVYHDLTPDAKSVLYYTNWGHINDPSSKDYKYSPNGGYDEEAIWKTYEEALENGLQEGLKLILCKHEYSDGTGTGYNVCKKCGDMY
jgi:hypothetical protein